MHILFYINVHNILCVLPIYVLYEFKTSLFE